MLEQQKLFSVKTDLMENKMIKHAISMIPNWKELTIEHYALLTVGFGLMYFSLGVFGIHFNISVGIIFFSLAFYLKMQLDRVRKEGLVNLVSPRIRRLLLRRSLFDVLCDCWYFPIS